MVLKLITNNFFIENSKNYTDSLTNYLQFNNYFRLLISDVFNYLLFNKTSDAEKEKLNSVGYCSILIKLKFFLMKIQSNSMDEKMKEFGERIIENIGQLGKYSQNENFINFLKDLLSKDSNEKIPFKKNLKKDNEGAISRTHSQILKEIPNPAVINSKESQTDRKQEVILLYLIYLTFLLECRRNNIFHRECIRIRIFF